MREIHMRYHLKRISGGGAEAAAVSDSTPLVHLSSENRYSVPPSRKNRDTAIAYSKGKLSAMPDISWDEDKDV